jgi:hypothetical protein
MREPIKLICFISLFLSSLTGLAQKDGKKELDQDLKRMRKVGKKFEWESLSEQKQVSVNTDSIHLSGTWKAYNGLFNFNGVINSMNLFKPFVIQINGASISRSESANLVPLDIIDNKLLVKGEKIEEGFINMLTDKVLVISWKNGRNYTRYYYERSE